MAERHCGVSCHDSSAPAELRRRLHLQANPQNTLDSHSKHPLDRSQTLVHGALDSNHSQPALRASDRNISLHSHALFSCHRPAALIC